MVGKKRKINKEDKEWANAVKLKDGSKCAICGSTINLNAHHIIPREIKPLKYNIDNGITLCPLHHRFSFELSAHQNPIAFFKWMQLNKYAQLSFLLSTCKI